MLKKSLMRGINSFMFSIGIYTIIQVVILTVRGGRAMIPVLPEFAAHFPDTFTAVYIQSILIGLTSAVFGAGSVIMELERLSLVVQSILYFTITTAVWIPVGCFCFGLHKYPATMLTMGLSYLVSYGISWYVQYRLCKRNIEQINQKLSELRMEGAMEE